LAILPARVPRFCVATAPVSKKGDSEMKFWSDRRGAVEIATFSKKYPAYKGQ